MTRRTKKRFVAGIVVLLLVGFLGLAGIAGRSYQRNRSIQNAYELAIAQYEQHDYEAALPNFSHYIGRNPRDVETLLIFADCRRRVAQPNDAHLRFAVRLANEAANIEPGNVAAKEMLLELYGSMGYFLECSEVAEDLLALDPEHRQAQQALVSSRAGLRQFELAIDASEAWIQRHPDDMESAIELVGLYVQSGQSDRAIERAEELAAAHPDDPRPIIVLLTLHAQRGDRIDERELLGRVANTTADSPKTLAWVVEAMDRLQWAKADAPDGDQGANAYLVKHEAIPELADAARVIQTIRLWKAGREGDALAYFATDDVALEQLPAPLVGWVGLIGDAGDGWGERARDELLTRDTVDASAWCSIIQARDDIANGALSDARTKLESALVSPAWSAAAYLLGRLQSRVGEMRAALISFQALEVANAEPLWMQPKIAHARLLLDLGRPREAKEVAASMLPALRMGHGTANVVLTYADSVIAHAEAAGASGPDVGFAQAMIDEACAQTPEFGPVLTRQAQLHAINGDIAGVQQAVELIRQATIRPLASDLLRLARTIERIDTTRAHDVLALAAAEFPDDPAVLLRRAVSMADDGKPDEALELLTKALETRTGLDRWPMMQVLATYLASRDPDRSLDVLSEISDGFPEQADAQRFVLDSELAWTDRVLIEKSIERLLEVTGDGSTGWRIARARALVTFDPSEARAALVGADVLPPVIAVDPDNPEANLLLAIASLTLGDRETAIRRANIAADSPYSNPWVFTLLVDLLQKAGRVDDAERTLRVFTGRTGLDPELRRNRAKLLAHQHMWTEAIRDYRALAQNPGTVEDRLAYVLICNERGMRDEAMREVNALKSDHPDNRVVRLARARIVASSDIDGALAEAMPALDGVEPAEAADILVDLYESSGDVDSAQSVLENLTRESPSASASAKLVAFLMRHERLDAAAVAVAAGIAVSPEDPTLKMLDGQLHGDSNERIAALSEMLADMSKSTDSPVLGELSQAVGNAAADPDAYLATLQRVAREHPSLPQVWMLLVEHYYARAAYEAAVGAARSAMQMLPNDPHPAQSATNLLIGLGRYDDALGTAIQWKDRSLNAPFEPDVAIARVQFMRGRTPEASQILDAWRAQIELRASVDPADLELLWLVDAASGRAGDVRAKALSLATTDSAWRPRCVRIANRIPMEQLDERRTWLRSIESLPGNDENVLVQLVAAWYTLAVVTQRDDDLDQVLALGRPLADERVLPAGVLGMLATCESLSDAIDDAERHYRDALAFDPDSPDLLNNLAFLLYDKRRGDLSHALEMARRAVDHSSSRPTPAASRREYLDTLGQILLAHGDPEAALASFDAAIGLDSRAAHLYVGRARACHSLARVGDAFASLDEAERLGKASRRPDAFMQSIEDLRKEWQ